jgi:excisionase family DNA binding protein
MSSTTLETPNPEKLFYGRDRAADLLDVSTRLIDEAIRAGDLEAYRLGRRVLIPRAALIEFAERVRSPRDKREWSASGAGNRERVESISQVGRGRNK